jgi:hypothetical protein
LPGDLKATWLLFDAADTYQPTRKFFALQQLRTRLTPLFGQFQQNRETHPAKKGSNKMGEKHVR